MVKKKKKKQRKLDNKYIESHDFQTTQEAPLQMQFTIQKLMYNEDVPQKELTNIDKNDQEEVPVKKQLNKKKEKRQKIVEEEK